jgi:phosphoenolpyruvate-protein phosphotransferase (PTS system enzyme I)
MSPQGERICTGTVASSGLAAGSLWRARHADPGARRAGTPEEERAALEAAMARAGTQLEQLAGGLDETGRAILQFQIALLADPELAAPAFADIRVGKPAGVAWSQTMAAEIAAYEAGGDAYFAERAADLRDLTDRVLRHLAASDAAEAAKPPEGAILFDADLTPSRFLETDWSVVRGAALLNGGAAGHVAILARARGVPMLTGVRLAPEAADGTPALLDAEVGRLILDPEPTTQRDYAARIAAGIARRREEAVYLRKPAATADGVPVKVYVNVDDPALLGSFDAAQCDGVGLTRTEFLFHGDALPDEETQYRSYAGLMYWAGGRPVTIRTLDAGGDKPIRGLTPEGEANPFLGVRGLRLSLARPEVFTVQLRALARAAAKGTLRVMVPMVSVPRELDEARRMMEAAVEALRREGREADMPAFGMMVEVPAAALRVHAFAADFVSIGTNDLIQYTMAVSRDAEGLDHLRDARDPAVLELIERVARHGAQTGLEVSVCGNMAGEVEQIDALLAAGIRALSVPPAALGAVKAALAKLRIGAVAPAALT